MSERVKHRYEFDRFYFDPQERLLTRNGKPIPLTPKVFDTLILLVENGGHLVLKDDLMKALWPNSFVEEVNLTQNISQLRKALGDNPQEQRYIVTVAGRGYRFAAEVKEATGPGNGSELIIGRNSSQSRDVIEEEHEAGSDPELVVAPTPQSKWVIWLTDAGVVDWAKRLVPAALTALAAVGFFMVFHRQPKLVSTDRIVLADFQNKTGDPVFDDTLKQALAAKLQQSPFLTVLSDQKIHETLRLMGHAPGDRLNEETAQDLCQRVRTKVVLSGAIASLGNHYVLTLNAANCATGDSLDREVVEVVRKEDVLHALDKAATQLRRKLGESLSSIQRFDTPIADVTTPSLDALKAWTAASRSEEGEAAAIPMLKRAIDLDPNFAMAHARLGTMYANLHEPSLAAESMKKAYDLRDRVSEWEKFYIESHYYHFVTGELEKGNQVYEFWAQAYPRDESALINLGATYPSLGQYEKAVAETLEAIRRGPDNPVPYNNLVILYADLNRLDDARATYQQAIQHKLDTPPLHVALYEVASAEGDTAEMARQVAWAAGKPGVEDILLSKQANTEAFYGRAAKARDFSRRAVESARSADEKETAALWQMNAALREGEFGNLYRARQGAAAALALAPTRDVQTVAALVLAQAGDAVQAQRMTEDLARRFPLDTRMNAYWLPTIRAAIELDRNNPAKAIELLQGAAPYELGEVPFTAEGAAPLHPVYVRGQAYLRLRQGKEAAQEYQKFLDRRSLVRNCTPGVALAYIGLGRAYALQRDTPRARAAYQSFLMLWKDADPDIPILKEAKAEYAKLQ